MAEETLDLRQMRTTIWLRKGTKQLLDRMADRGESYDEVIRRLIRDNEDIHTRTEQLSSDSVIKATLSNENWRKSVLIIAKGEEIHYTFNMPSVPFGDSYRFRIVYDRVLHHGKTVKEPMSRYKANREMATDYLRVLEKIIKTFIDPLFQVDDKQILDLDWWSRQFKMLGLSRGCYQDDIILALNRFNVIA